METDYLYIMLTIGLAVGIIAAAGIVLYYTWLMHRMAELLESFEHGKRSPESETRETYESKLVSRLKRLLEIAEARQEKAIEEKEQTAQLLSDLSHQLKTPMANVIMDTELLQDDSLNKEERQEFLMHAKSQTEKMQWLMNTLIKASRLEQGMISFESDYTGVRETLAMGIGAVYAQAQQKHITIRTEDFKEIKLFHNPKWTAEALANILENAVKYSPEESTIQIRIVPMDIYTRMEVEDEGRGIPIGDYNKIFKRFYRGINVERQEGSGLGLYLAQLIMRKQGGYITVSSVEEKGSCFFLYLLNKIQGVQF